MTDNNDPKDGFDLIEFPSTYSFKAMCRAIGEQHNPSDIVNDLVLEHVSETHIVELRSAKSRTGKFESITVTVMVQDRNTLEAIYQTLADSSHVVMTL